MTPISVAVIDSGIGGLTIAQEMIAQLPGICVHYAADLARFPYGLLSPNEIFERLSAITSCMIARYQPTIVVIACNTGSTLALDLLRQTFTIPFVGVVPAIKPAANLTLNGYIGVLATQATVNSPYLKALIQTFAKDKTVYTYAPSSLVHLAEQKMTQDAGGDIQAILNNVVAGLVDQEKMDTVVLACTHFPVLKTELMQAMPHILHWVDSGEAIARRVRTLLTELIEGFDCNTIDSAPPMLNTFNCTSLDYKRYRRDAIELRLGRFDYVLTDC